MYESTNTNTNHRDSARSYKRRLLTAEHTETFKYVLLLSPWVLMNSFWLHSTDLSHVSWGCKSTWHGLTQRGQKCQLKPPIGLSAPSLPVSLIVHFKSLVPVGMVAMTAKFGVLLAETRSGALGWCCWSQSTDEMKGGRSNFMGRERERERNPVALRT